MTCDVCPLSRRCAGTASLRLAGAMVALGSAAAMLSAQTTTAAPQAQQRGVYLFGGSASFGYSSLGPLQLAGSSQASGLRPDYFASSSVSAGYASTGPAGALTLTYTPTYVTQFRYRDISGFGQTLSLGLFRRAGAKSTLSFGISASDNRVAQFAFAAGGLSRLAAAPGTAEALGAAVTGRSYADVPIASVLSTPALTDAAAQAALYGARVLSISGSASSSYMHSPRTMIFVSANGMRNQPLQTTDGTQPAAAVSLQSVSMEARSGISYGLSGRSTAGFSGGYRRSQSQYAESGVADVSGSFGRQLSRNWFGSGTGGIARVDQAGSRFAGFAIPAAPRYTFSGSASLGVRLRSHTFLSRYRRGAGDTYGLGSGRNQAVELAWSLGRPGRSWSATVSGAREEMTRGLQDIQMWNVQASLSRTLNPYLSLVFSTSWLENSTRQKSLLPMVSGYYARVTFVFSSRGREGTPRQ